MPGLVVICVWLNGSHWGELTCHGSLTTHNFLRVVGLVIPWNYPLMMLAWKMGACLAAGNTVILKPAKVCTCHITQKKNCKLYSSGYSVDCSEVCRVVCSCRDPQGGDQYCVGSWCSGWTGALRASSGTQDGLHRLN